MRGLGVQVPSAALFLADPIVAGELPGHRILCRAAARLSVLVSRVDDVASGRLRSHLKTAAAFPAQVHQQRPESVRMVALPDPA